MFSLELLDWQHCNDRSAVFPQLLKSCPVNVLRQGAGERCRRATPPVGRGTRTRGVVASVALGADNLIHGEL
jgi:hypothetical protein